MFCQGSIRPSQCRSSSTFRLVSQLSFGSSLGGTIWVLSHSFTVGSGKGQKAAVRLRGQRPSVRMTECPVSLLSVSAGLLTFVCVFLKCMCLMGNLSLSLYCRVIWLYVTQWDPSLFSLDETLREGLFSPALDFCHYKLLLAVALFRDGHVHVFGPVIVCFLFKWQGNK